MVWCLVIWKFAFVIPCNNVHYKRLKKDKPLDFWRTKEAIFQKIPAFSTSELGKDVSSKRLAAKKTQKNYALGKPQG